MRPIEQAKALCRYRNISFEELVAETLGNPTGAIIMRPDCFAIARAVQLEDDRIAWRIEVAVGNFKEMVRLLKPKLPYIFYTRGRDPLHPNRKDRDMIFATDQLLRHAQ